MKIVSQLSKNRLIMAIAVAVTGTLLWMFFDPRQVQPGYDHADVVAALPGVDNTNCHSVIGEFSAAPDLPISHMEGAMGKTSIGFTAISGFSHFQENVLMASSRVDILKEGEERWQPAWLPTPTINTHIQGAAYQDDVWIAGGFVGQNTGIATDAVWRLNTLTGNWSAGPALPSPRASSAFVESNGQLHLISGLAKDRQSVINEHLVLNAEDPVQWQSEAFFPRARNHFQAVSIGDLIFAVGGMTGHDKKYEDLPYLDVYHPIFKKWLSLADLPESRSHAEMSTFVYDNRIIVVGGRTEGNFQESLDTIIEYNPYTNQWKKIGHIPEPRYAPFANIVNGKFYVGGGGTVWSEQRTESWIANIETLCGEA